MAYSNPDRRSYVFPAVDFGAGNTSHSFQGPKGKAGRLVAIHLSASETFTNTTTQGQILVGTGADTDAYALMNLGTTAATDSVSSDDGVTDTDAILSADIPADTQVEVTCVAPTGGTPAGIGTVTVLVDWAH